MASFKKTNTKIYQKLNPEVNADTGFWKNYSACVLKEYGFIDYVDFSPVQPYNFAVTCSCRVQVYDPTTKLVVKTLNKFKKAAHGGSFRRDGRLLCAGDDEGFIKLFDINSKSLLRVFTGHKAPVHRTFFTMDGLRIASFCDDKTTTLWDVASEKKIISFADHTDYVRAGAMSPVSPDVYLSGGYDKIVNMYDTRTNEKVFSVCHDAPVESIIYDPTGGLFFTAGGTEIRVWDTLKNGALVDKFSQHHKTITCLRMARNGRRIMSGSLDNSIKIYDAVSHKPVHSLDYPNSILSMGISADDTIIVAGMQNGLISIKKREEKIDEKIASNKKQRSKIVAARNAHSPLIDMHVEENSKEKEPKYDEYFRKFEFSKALDCVMKSYTVKSKPHVTISVMQELIRRNGLAQAVAGRDGKPLVNIIRFVTRHIDNPIHQRTMCDVEAVITQVYGKTLRDLDQEVQSSYKYLQKKIQERTSFAESIIKMGAVMDTLLAWKIPKVVPTNKSLNLQPSAKAQKPSVYDV